MNIEPARIFSLGDNAVTVEFGERISRDLNRAAINLANYFNTNPFTGLVEAVPAMASATLFYRPHEIRDKYPQFPTAFELVRSQIINALSFIQEGTLESSSLIEIPVSFASENAPDLAGVAEYGSVSVERAIEIFTGRIYRVYMLGFLPGFAYMGEVDDRIAAPRKATPRAVVPRGSVGIAGRQTGVYPAESPGGWQLIGRTTVDLLTGDRDSPCLLKPGDSVRFSWAEK